jgi:serine acetyltransferase
VGVVFQGRAGRRLTLYTQSVCFAGGAALAPSLDGAPRLGDGVSIGVHASVCGAVRVGSRVRLAFNVALGRDAPDGARVVSRAMRSAVRNGSVTAP